MKLIEDVLLLKTVDHQEIECRKDLIELLRWCSCRRQRRVLSETAMQVLFNLCCVTAVTGEVRNLEIGKAVVPVVVSRCKEILKEYLNDDRQQDRCPLPKSRHDEVVGVLDRLAVSDLCMLIPHYIY